MIQNKKQLDVQLLFSRYLLVPFSKTRLSIAPEPAKPAMVQRIAGLTRSAGPLCWGFSLWIYYCCRIIGEIYVRITVVTAWNGGIFICRLLRLCIALRQRIDGNRAGDFMGRSTKGYPVGLNDAGMVQSPSTDTSPLISSL